MNDNQLDLLTGKYSGKDATTTETLSGSAIELDNLGPLRPGGAGHSVLSVYRQGELLTSYEASYRARGDYHSRRREATRLLVRGFLEKDGVLPNPAPGGRPHVDAYRITQAGLDELERLDSDY